MREAGLAVEVDARGNLFGRSGERDDVWVGSHLDTVPQGGRFDGALGVVAGDRGGRAGRGGSVVAFRGEEVGCVGSRALCASGDALPSAFLELHVEQGPVLGAAGAPLGVVTSIVGYARGELVVRGPGGARGDDADGRPRRRARGGGGRDPPHPRRRARGSTARSRPSGELEVEPGGEQRDSGPRRGSASTRARPTAERLDELLARDRLRAGAARRARADGERPRRSCATRSRRAGLPPVELPSGAGHDAGILAAAGVPSAMLFVRSLNGGVSHSPDELSSDEDVALAVDVLAAALARLGS